MREITTEWLRLSVKADALVTEPMRMQETGCGWCLLSGQQSPSPYLLARTLVATAHSSPMAEITVTCGEHTHQHVQINHLKLYTCSCHLTLCLVGKRRALMQDWIHLLKVRTLKSDISASSTSGFHVPLLRDLISAVRCLTWQQVSKVHETLETLVLVLRSAT